VRLIKTQSVINILTRPLIPHPAARWIILLLVVIVGIQKLGHRPSAFNGFELTRLTLPVAQIEYGGPPRDGIPALTDPRVVSAAQSPGLRPGDRVIGVVFDGEARAYPIRILNHHEIVNDTLGRQDFLVTYCPLCGSGIVFDARINDQRLVFGVSGLLYNSDVLMYDRQTESLWSQLRFAAVSGPLSGAELEALPATHTSWRDWRQQHPETTVLSFDTGYNRDYQRNPYRSYSNSPLLYFGVDKTDPRYPLKSRVVGIIIAGQARAYPYSELQKLADRWLPDELGQQRLQIRFQTRNQRFDALDSNGKPVAVIPAYWFAWMAFHPDSSIFTAPDDFAAQ